MPAPAATAPADAQLTWEQKQAAKREREFLHVPVVDAGVILTYGSRSADATSTMPAESDTAFGVALRASASLIGALTAGSFGKARFGDYIGFEIGGGPGGVIGRIITGLLGSYDLSDDVGVGARAYYDTKWDPAFDAGDDNTQQSVFFLEAVGRYRRIHASARFSIHGKDSGGFLGFTDQGVHDVGVSVRIPALGKNKEWSVGLDYDHITIDTMNRNAGTGGSSNALRTGLLYCF